MESSRERRQGGRAAAAQPVEPGGRLVGAAAAFFVLAATTATHAQTPFVPYFGKNQIRYDNFQWYIYTTDHFRIYYYPETELWKVY